MNNIVFIHDLETYKPMWLERLILWFCVMQKMESEAGIIHFKYFLNRLYIYSVESRTKTNEIAVPWNDGNPGLN